MPRDRQRTSGDFQGRWAPTPGIAQPDELIDPAGDSPNFTRETKMTRRADVAVIGGGIVGLAFAWTAARQGKSVVLFERDPKAQGASVRNFGMVWPIGQAAGALHRTSLRSRELWVELAGKVGLGHDPIGSLHLAYKGDELAVLEEFEDRSAA